MVKLAVQRWDQAISFLEEAITRAPADWTLYSDLGVVYLSRFKQEKEPYDLVLALTSLDQALKYRPGAPEALFNRALALDRLFLPVQAQIAWDKYFTQNPNSGCVQRGKVLLQADTTSRVDSVIGLLAGAARNGSRVNAEDLVTRDPQTVRLYVEEEVLAQWSRAETEARRNRAADLLDLAEALGSALALQSGDHLLKDSVRSIEQSHGVKRAVLARGFASYRVALRYYKTRDIERAAEMFRAARHLLNQVNSPFVRWTDFHLAACAYLDKDYANTLNRVRELQNDLRGRLYPNLSGRVQWLLGVVLLERGDANAAVAALSVALSEFQRTRETGNQAAVLSLIAHCYEALGDSQMAWRYRLRGLETAAESQDRQRLPVILAEAVRAAMRERNYSVALAFQDEALRLNLRTRDPLSLTEAFWRRARVHQSAGAQEAALADLATARRHSKLITHPTARRTTKAGILATEGAALRVSDPMGAIQALTEAERIYSELDFRYLTVEILLDRAYAYKELGDDRNAERDFKQAFELFEERRISIDDPLLQIAYFAQARLIFDELLARRLRYGTGAEAFDFLERGRARWLAQEMSRVGAIECRLGSPRLATRGDPSGVPLWMCIPSRTAIIEYAILKERVYAVLATQSGVSVIELPTDPLRLERQTAAFLRCVQRCPEEAIVLAERLFADLMEPLLPALRGYESLVFVPDKFLHLLPFAALRDRFTRRHLIEHYLITTAPSTSVYLACLARENSDVTESDTTALVIGNPALDRARFPFLPNLSWSGREARWIGSIFPGSVVLVEEAATVERFRLEAHRHRIIHFGGHALVSADGLSKLVFASAEGKLEELSAIELRALPLGSTGLFFLAACKTSSGRVFNLEGVFSLASPLLAGGVPAVVVTLWDVDDASSSSLLRPFYSRLRERWAPAAALRSAQLAALERERANSQADLSWSSFQLIGASY